MAIYQITATGNEIEAEAAFMATEYPNGGYTLISPDGTPAPTVPQTVTAAQFMMALSQQTYYQTVLTYVGTLPAADQLAFNRTDVFNRTDALINSLAPNVPLTSAQLDALFTAAAAISP